MLTVPPLCFCVSVVDTWNSTWCMIGEWSLAWPRLAPELRAFSCPSPSLPGKITLVWSAAGPAVLYDLNELSVLLGNELPLRPQMGVHAWACQRYPGGWDAGGATKPQGVGVTTDFTSYMSILTTHPRKPSLLYFIMVWPVWPDQQQLTLCLPK